MKKSILIAFCLLLGSSAFGASPPKPTKSEYLLSTGAGIALSADDGARYGMNFAVIKQLPTPTYFTVIFENPEKGGVPLQVQETLAVGATEIAVKSDRLTKVRNNRKYLVEVKLYSDESRSKLIGTHKQQVLFAVPAQLVQQIEQKFGVKVE